tara:strand:+ start:9076 stop:10356 length:1281 start_codon:yes stop_codon:yes gene_type:complete
MNLKEGSIDLNLIGRKAVNASRELSKLSSEVKAQALVNLAECLRDRQSEVIDANRHDFQRATQNKMSNALTDRLILEANTLENMAQDVLRIASLSDPIGRELDMKILPNGLRVGKVSVPIGVIGAIYESRPNVTVDIASLCFKSGNAVILRGGSEAASSNRVLASIIRDGFAVSNIPDDAVQLINSSDRKLVKEMLLMDTYIDLIVPRGGAELVSLVANEARMPAITGGVGVCHTYVDEKADLDMAKEIVNNAKVQRPYVCNALDTVIIHSSVASDFLDKIMNQWAIEKVEVRADLRTRSILGQRDDLTIKTATEDDWGQEFLSLTAAIKIVDNIDEAIAHIQEYTSGHTEAIITDDNSASMRFLDEVDAGVVMVNTSTRFNDGSQFGLGAELGISTGKLHARGPIGLNELTTYKWVVYGSGQIRS